MGLVLWLKAGDLVVIEIEVWDCCFVKLEVGLMVDGGSEVRQGNGREGVDMGDEGWPWW